MSRTLKIAIAAFALSLTAAPALAQAKDASIRVAYGDIDVSKPAGGAVLLKRIEVAARKVCDQATPRTQLKPHAAAVCRRETVESTVRGLNIGTLTLAWSGKYPTTNMAER